VRGDRGRPGRAAALAEAAAPALELERATRLEACGRRREPAVHALG
jgi:hypothetical protein